MLLRSCPEILISCPSRIQKRSLRSLKACVPSRSGRPPTYFKESYQGPSSLVMFYSHNWLRLSRVFFVALFLIRGLRTASKCLLIVVDNERLYRMEQLEHKEHAGEEVEERQEGGVSPVWSSYADILHGTRHSVVPRVFSITCGPKYWFPGSMGSWALKYVLRFSKNIIGKRTWNRLELRQHLLGHSLRNSYFGAAFAFLPRGVC